MKAFTSYLVTAFLVVAMQASFAAISPVGQWKTIDDVSGNPKSILHIYEENGALFGQVVKIFPRPGHDQNEICAACTGDRHNQRIVGMVVMEGLKQSPDHPGEWRDGHILDPLNGKTYRCLIQVSHDGSKLKVRGYLGLPLFGRSQTWLRESS